jgi:3-oxoacyl-[acyl-carrier protein] reductase
MQLTYQGTRALILGGTCRMALNLARALMAEKIEPVLTCRSESGRAAIEAAMRDAAGPYTICPLDLAQPDSFSGLDAYLSPGCDYCVDFAQDDLEGLAASVDGTRMHHYLETTIAGRAQVLQRVARAMLVKRFGRMVFISSAGAKRFNPGQGIYAASKQAAETLYKAMGVELAARGITTVSLRPGYVNTGRGRTYLDRAGQAALAKVPLGRALAVNEVVDTIMFLLSDSAMGINAAAVTMDGGITAAK